MPTFHRPRVAIIDEGRPPLPAAVILVIACVALAVALAARHALAIVVTAGAIEAAAVTALSVLLARQRLFQLVWRPAAPPAPARQRLSAQVITAPAPRVAEAPMPAAIEAPGPREIHQTIHLYGVDAAALAAVLAGQHRSTLPLKENP